MAEYWVKEPELSLHQQQWDDEFVVYNASSGDTHLFDSISIKILSLLESHSMSTDAILSEVNKTQSDELDLFFISELLESMARYGLIKRRCDAV